MNWKHFIYAIKIKLKKNGFSAYADEILMAEVAAGNVSSDILSDVVSVINKIETENAEAFDCINSETDSLRQALKRMRKD
jgi:hypothetical protein